MNKKEKEKRKIWIRIKGLEYIIQVWNDTQNTKKKNVFYRECKQI